MTHTATGALRAVDYLRVSTEEQAKGYGIAYSGKKTAKHIASKGWEHAGTYADEGVSGALEAHQRPDLKRLMEDARRTPRPFDVVVVNEGRAIGRTGRAFWRWVWELEDLGVFVAVVKSDYDNSTDEGRSKMRKDADYAEEERVVIRQRTQGGIQEKAEEGGWPGGRTPYGWSLEHKGIKGLSRAVRNDAEHAVLLRAWELLVLHGRNSRKAALALNSEGLLTREGKPWSGRNLLNKLRSEAVQKGQATFRKEGRAKVGRDGKPLYGQSVVIPLQPAFEAGELARLNASLARDSVKRDTAGAPVYPLTKRIIGQCGNRYTGFRRFGVRGYRCSGKLEKYAGAEVCGCSLLDADVMEAAVWADICDLLGDADKLKSLSEEWVGMAANGRADHAQRLADLDRQIEAQSNAIALTISVAAKQAALRKLGLTAAEEAVDRAVRPLGDELAELEKMRAEVIAWQHESEQVAQRAADLQQLAELARTHLHRLEAAQQAEVLGLLGIRVVITSPPARRAPGGPARLPGARLEGEIEPTLLTGSLHLGERSLAETEPQVSFRTIPFRVDMAW